MAFGLKRRKVDPIEIGTRAEAILESDAWQEAWEAYRTRLYEMIEQAPADDAHQVMHLKSLLATAHQCRHHLECLLKDGRLEQEKIQLESTERRRLTKIAPLIRNY